MGKIPEGNSVSWMIALLVRKAGGSVVITPREMLTIGKGTLHMSRSPAGAFLLAYTPPEEDAPETLADAVRSGGCGYGCGCVTCLGGRNG